MKPKSILATLIIIISLSTIQGQSEKKVGKLLQKYIEDIRNGKIETVDKKLLQPQNLGFLLKASQKYLNDKNQRVKTEIYRLIAINAEETKEKEVKEKAVYILAMGTKDIDPGIVGVCCGYLEGFDKESFSQKTKDSLTAIIKREPPFYQRMAKIAGFLNLSPLKPYFYDKIRFGKLKIQKRWGLHLALARMGEQQEAEYCLNKVKRLEVNDDMIYDILPDLAYIRDKKTTDFMIEILMDEEKRCLSPDPENEIPIQCGYRVMEQLAPIIENFPLSLSISGDIETEDYDKALYIARKWIQKNKDNYKLRNDRY